MLLKFIVRKMLYDGVAEFTPSEQLTSAKETVSLGTNMLPKDTPNGVIAAEPAQMLATFRTPILGCLVGMACAIVHVPRSIHTLKPLHFHDAQVTTIGVSAHREEAVLQLKAVIAEGTATLIAVIGCWRLDVREAVSVWLTGVWITGTGVTASAAICAHVVEDVPAVEANVWHHGNRGVKHYAQYAMLIGEGWNLNLWHDV